MTEGSLSYVEFTLRVLVATMGGVLIGVERERMQLGRGEVRARSIPGVRSFGLISIYGCLSSLTASLIAGGDSLIWSVVFASLTLGLALFLAIYAYMTMMGRRAPGITTYMVILVAYMIGALSGMGRLLEAASVSVLSTLLLALKNPAVTIAKAISYEELIAIMEVATLALIIGPIVATYSTMIPWIDVYKVYLFFLLVLTLSLVSYGAARIWGPRGLIYGVTLGSIVNSEATIASTTRLIGLLVGDEGERARISRLLTILVVSIMQARSSTLALLSIALFAGPLAIAEVPLLALLALTSIITAIVSFNKSIEIKIPPITVASPLSWYTAIKAALTYTILIALSKLLEVAGAPTITYVPLVVLGGFVNATATMIGIASTITTIGVVNASTLAMMAVAAATMNKIVYSDRASLGERAYKTVVTTTLAMTLIPLVMVLTQVAYSTLTLS